MVTVLKRGACGACAGDDEMYSQYLVSNIHQLRKQDGEGDVSTCERDGEGDGAWKGLRRGPAPVDPAPIDPAPGFLRR
jgi:hypothetical protein